MDLDFEDPFLDFLLADSTSNVSSIEDKKRPREASEASDDGKSDGRRSTTPEPAKKRKKIDPVSLTQCGRKLWKFTLPYEICVNSF